MKALRAGGSTREVGALTKMSHTAIRRIGLKAGWPDAAEKRKRAAEFERTKRWRA